MEEDTRDLAYVLRCIKRPGTRVFLEDSVGVLLPNEEETARVLERARSSFDYSPESFNPKDFSGRRVYDLVLKIHSSLMSSMARDESKLFYD